ncbi:MAG: hypothetical protein HFI13_10055 [Lachnospiraceae bacterium]|nr:hypothetical protein [Lachnospiraceae bacterium]
MESMRDVDRVMEREAAKGSCPLRFVKIDFSDSPYQEIASREKLLEVLSYLLRTGDYGRFAGKGTGNNVYMDMKGKKAAFKRTRSFIDRNNIFSAIRRYGKKIKPDFDGPHCISARRAVSADMDISGTDFSDKEQGIASLEGVRNVLFQCLLFDTIKCGEAMLYADLCTIYCLK